jgi:hypothetical protein
MEEPEPFPLPHLPTRDDPAWGVVQGETVVAEYFTRSPYSSIELYRRGYVVRNHVVGKGHPCASWADAKAMRDRIVAHYQAISGRHWSE